MSYLREACGVTRWEGENKESVYERHGTFCKWSEVWCSGMGEKQYFEMVCPIERKNSEEFVKKAYVSEIVGPMRRGRLG